MKKLLFSSIKKLPIATIGVISIILGIVSKANAVSFYSITNLGSSNYDSFNYLDELAVGGKAYTATAYVRGDEYIYYNDGTKEYLGSLDTSPGYYRTRAIAINNQNQVIGSSGYASAFIWSKETGIQPVTGVGRIPSASGYVSVSDINNLGQVAGTAGSPSAGTGGFINSNGSIVGIGIIPGYDLGLGGTSALGINDKGQVVGVQSSSTSSRLSLAILYEEGKLYDLNNLIQDNPGWLLENALDISNRGQIVGTGLFNGQRQTFLATPNAKDVPEPSQIFSILAFGAIGAGYIVKRGVKNASKLNFNLFQTDC